MNWSSKELEKIILRAEEEGIYTLELPNSRIAELVRKAIYNRRRGSNPIGTDLIVTINDSTVTLTKREPILVIPFMVF